MPPHERRPPPGRRMLALPAVCPCEAISPGTLLASLVTLAADVAGRDAAAFPVLRRGAGEAVRIAGVLLAFLQEVQEASSAVAPLPGGAVLGLSELHVAMQKLLFLLADCARKGARLWVLMNAELVASGSGWSSAPWPRRWTCCRGTWSGRPSRLVAEKSSTLSKSSDELLSDDITLGLKRRLRLDEISPAKKIKQVEYISIKGAETQHPVKLSCSFVKGHGKRPRDEEMFTSLSCKRVR